ncbi:mediator of DNA damage checkpoint protein 1 isoform X1 [Cynocephalus volans]|uniref:mediator of DNA damage checkpoint protein 1 isoform X1 n=1 Tax=Cynocephalus volans TaxID=110931 RepID=UPI002FCAE2EB
MMEDTQAVDWDVEEEEETEQSGESLGYSLEPAGRLHVFSSARGPEKDFPLYLGKNVVGRMPDCSVALPFPSISKQHAVIEIFAWDKAPILRDCGSLNGTQILRPPKVLSPGASHRLRDQDLILFADLPCQYHRLDVPLPFISRGHLTVEETPRVQGGTQPQKLLLAEDSEEEVDSLSERNVVKESKITSSPLATIVPESDEEGPSPAPSGPRRPFAFNLDSDTDEEEGQQPSAGDAPSAARRGAAAEAEQPEDDGVATEIQLEKDQPSVKERDNYSKVERKAGNGVVPVGVILERSQPPEKDSDTDMDDDSRPPGRPTEVHLERAQPSGFINSDTDVEEEGIPATPAVVPMKKRQIFHGVGTRNTGAPSLAHLQECQAGSDTDVEEGEEPLAVPLEQSQASVVIDSDTDDEEQVSAALTLARLKESRAVMWNRDTDGEENRAQPVVLLEQSQTATGRDSDTDVEEEGLSVEKRETVPKGHTDKAGALVIEHSEKGQSPLGDSDVGMEADRSSSGIHLERSHASAIVDINTEMGEKVPPGPAVIHPEMHQVPVEGTDQTDVEAEGGQAKLPVVPLEEAQPPPDGDCETDVEEGMSSAALAVADVRKSQLPAEGDAGTEWAVAVLERERALEVGAQGGSPVAQVEQDLLPVSRENLSVLVVDTGILGEPQREGAQIPTGKGTEPDVGVTKDSKDNHGDSEDLDLQATQCFVERENQSLEGALDEPWEVLATQPFCLRESEASETQPIAAYLEAHGFCLSSPRATPQDQHPESPVHTEPLGIQGRGMPTVEKDLGTAKETAERVTPERDTKKLSPEGEREDAMGDEELTRGHLNCKMPPAEQASRGDQESADACLPPTVPEASATPPHPLISQSQTHLACQPLLSPSAPPFQPCIPKTRQNGSQEAPETPLTSELQPFHPKPTVSPPESSRMTPSLVSSTAVEPHPTLPTAQALSPEPTSRATQGRTCRSSSKTPEPVVPTAPELQSSTSKDQPVIPWPTTQASRGRTRKSSSKVPDPVVPTAPELQPSTFKDQPVTSKYTSRVTRSRTHGSSNKASEPVVPTAPGLQSSTSKDQPVIPGPTSRATRGRTRKSSSKTPDPIVPTAPELQPLTSINQPVTPKPTSRATRGRTHRSSSKTCKPIVPTAPELQSSTSKDHPVIPELISQATPGRTHTSSSNTPDSVVPTAPELQPSTSKDHPVIPGPTSWDSQGRTHRSSSKTPEPVVPTALELQPLTSTNQPVTPKPTSQAMRGRTRRSSSKTSEPAVPTVPELQSFTSKDQPIIPRPTSRATRGRTHRSSNNTPDPGVPIAPELQTLSSKDQPITPKPTSRATRGRTCRSSSKTSEPIVPTAPELQPLTSKDQPITPKPISQATQGRTRRSSSKTSEPIVPTAPELQPFTSEDQPVIPGSTSQATWGRTHMSSSKISEPVVSTVPEFQLSASKDQPVTPKATWGKTHRYSSNTPDPLEPIAPELLPSTSTNHLVTPNPISQATRGRTHRSSVKTSEPVEMTGPDLEPPTTTDHTVTSEAVARGGQSRTLRSSTTSAMPVPTTPGSQSPVTTAQPVLPEPIPQASCSRRQRTAGEPDSLTAPIFHRPCSAPFEPQSRSSRNQRPRTLRAVESLRTISEPSFPQLLEVPAHIPQVETVETAGKFGFAPEPQPKASQSHKRPLATMDSPPHQKRPRRREVPQKTLLLKEEEEDAAERPRKEEPQDVVVPGPVKRKRDQAEEEHKGIPNHSLRRTKPNQEPTAPKVLFTGVVDTRGERAVLALGGSLAGSVAEASHLVTDRIRRTVKFLCALGRGIPILSLDWLHQSRKVGCFLPPDEYVVTDPEQEKNFGFSLRDALSRARERRLLEGYEIHVTPGVQPPPPQMGEIISCCGGTVLPNMPRSYKPQRVVITCPQDFPRCSIPFRVGLPLLSPEFLLTGVLKQEAEPEAFVLSTLEMSST